MAGDRATHDHGATDWHRSRAHPVAEDLRLQRRFWIVQRIGWAIVVVFLIAAALGVFSEGVLSEASAVAADGGAKIEYQRFLRNGASSTIVVEAKPRNGGIAIRLGAAMLEKLEVESVNPAPASAGFADDGLRLSFASDASASGKVYFSVRPRAAGAIDATIAVGGTSAAERVPYRAFVYP